jgi:hypothetical protein
MQVDTKTTRNKIQLKRNKPRLPGKISVINTTISSYYFFKAFDKRWFNKPAISRRILDVA